MMKTVCRLSCLICNIWFTFPAGDIASTCRTLFMLVCTLAAWLHIVCGVSQAATAQVLKTLGTVVLLSVKLGQLLSLPSSSTTRYGAPSLPQDVRRAMSALSIEPNIVRSICCPKCFTKYTLPSLPQICLRRETPRSKPCSEKLWTT